MYKLLLILFLLPFAASAQTPMSKLLRKHVSTTVFKPTDITGLTIWYAADSLSGYSNGDPVATWPDLSGNANDALQAIGGLEPTYTTGLLNGKPGLHFTRTSGQFLQTVSLFTLSQPYTFFIVSRSTSSLVSQYYLDGGSQNTGILNINVILPNTFYLYAGSGLASAAGTVTNFNYVSVIYNGGSSLIAINGSANSVSSGSTGITGLTVGTDAGYTGTYLDGDILEIIYYNTGLGTTDRQRVETYLAAKYGL